MWSTPDNVNRTFSGSSVVFSEVSGLKWTNSLKTFFAGSLTCTSGCCWRLRGNPGPPPRVLTGAGESGAGQQVQVFTWAEQRGTLWTCCGHTRLWDKSCSGSVNVLMTQCRFRSGSLRVTAARSLVGTFGSLLVSWGDFGTSWLSSTRSSLSLSRTSEGDRETF